ncbi:hypothetical protein [Microbacterium sp.]|uniref:hypothetical protein n=1 Tax=Microbacterium sp. TaxID=51671 RepID=UPI003A8A369E
MATEDGWVSAEQYRGIRVGLRIVEAWADARDEPEEKLRVALQRETDLPDIVIGLATVARLLAIDLAAATGRSELAVVEHLGAKVEQLQHPVAGTPR